MDLRVICRDEYESYVIYSYLGKAPFVPRRVREVLVKASLDERNHYFALKTLAGECSSKISLLKVFAYLLALYLFGLTFILKLIESKEQKASINYREVAGVNHEFKPLIDRFIEDEVRHEAEFISSIDEARARYIGYIVLGVSDALIELTGVFTGALGVLNDAFKTGLMGLIAGLSASISMGIASYNQAREEGGARPHKPALYTSLAYVSVTVALATPFIIARSIVLAYTLMVAVAVAIIAYTTAYTSVLRNRRFTKEFPLTTAVLFGVSTLLYTLGSIIRSTLGINID